VACALLTTLTIAQQLPPSTQAAPAVDPRNLASVEGIILGGDRRPLPGVTLTLMNDAPPNQAGLYAPSRETTSDAIGRFSFQGLEPGEYRLTTERAGYFTPFGDLFKPVVLTTGQHLTDVVIHLAPEPVLSGKVTDENGDPMPGVTVRPLHIGSQTNGRLQTGSVGTLGWTYGVQTGADGEYQVTVDGNLAGRWFLSFSVKPDSRNLVPRDSALLNIRSRPALASPLPLQRRTNRSARTSRLTIRGFGICPWPQVSMQR
jgi:hypothetical protein